MKEAKSIETKLLQQENKERQDELDGDHPYHEKELEFKTKFDERAEKMAE